MKRRYSDGEIPEGPRQHPGLSASQRQKQKLEPKKCIICGSVLGTQRKYCPKCRPLRARELVREYQRKHKQKMREHQRKYQQKRRLALAASEIERLSSHLALPEDVKETAATIYKRATEKKLLQGRSIEDAAAAALYAACRERRVPRTLDEIAKVSPAKRRRILRAYRFIASRLSIHPPPIAPSDLIPRVCSKLRLSEATQSKTIQLLKEAAEKGITFGRSPEGAAAAVIYVTGALTGERRYQREVADAAGTTEVTLRNCLREVREKLNLPRVEPAPEKTQRKCIVCGAILEGQGKYCPACRKRVMQERYVAPVISEIDRISSLLALPAPVREAAAAIYRKAIERGLNRRWPNLQVAIALYAACRERGEPLTFDEITDAVQSASGD
jgi:transcription initiation factor TFIIIB Brf1 subunit/transcription initiation factor TFIIB